MIPPIETIDRFKRHAGYRLEPNHVALFLRPAVRRILLSPAVGAAMRTGERLLGSTGIIRSVHAMRHAARATAG